MFIIHSPNDFWVSGIHLLEFNLAKIRKLLRNFYYWDEIRLINLYANKLVAPIWVKTLGIVGRASMLLYYVFDFVVFLCFTFPELLPQEFTASFQKGRNWFGGIKVICMLIVLPMRLKSPNDHLSK